MKRLVVGLDGTLAVDEPGVPYPNRALVARLREYKAAGFEVVVAAARNMRTRAGNIGLINARALPAAVAWLQRHGIPFDEIHVGKPWCGTEGFYVDDKAVRPSEFVALGYEGARAARPRGRRRGRRRVTRTCTITAGAYLDPELESEFGRIPRPSCPSATAASSCASTPRSRRTPTG